MDLIDAVVNYNLTRVKSIVEEGVDKDKGDGDGWTPL